MCSSSILLLGRLLPFWTMVCCVVGPPWQWWRQQRCSRAAEECVADLLSCWGACCQRGLWFGCGVWPPWQWWQQQRCSKTVEECVADPVFCWAFAGSWDDGCCDMEASLVLGATAAVQGHQVRSSRYGLLKGRLLTILTTCCSAWCWFRCDLGRSSRRWLQLCCSGTS